MSIREYISGTTVLMVFLGVLGGIGITGLLFVFGITLASAVSSAALNPSGWGIALPISATIATALVMGGGVAVLKNRHLMAPVVVGMMVTAGVFFCIALGYYVAYLR